MSAIPHDGPTAMRNFFARTCKTGMLHRSKNKYLQCAHESPRKLDFFFACQQLSAFCKKMVAFYYKIMHDLSVRTKSLILCIFSRGVNLRYSRDYQRAGLRHVYIH